MAFSPSTHSAPDGSLLLTERHIEVAARIHARPIKLALRLVHALDLHTRIVHVDVELHAGLIDGRVNGANLRARQSVNGGGFDVERTVHGSAIVLEVRAIEDERIDRRYVQVGQAALYWVGTVGRYS